MRIEKFDEAAKELMHSVNYLTEQQQFYVIFFSDQMHPMFGAEAPDELIPASAANRERLQQYLGELPFHQGTKARPSMERALALKPDVIYLLGDGAFTDGTAKFLLGLKDNKVPICTVAFKSKEPGAKIMKQDRRHASRPLHVRALSPAYLTRTPRCCVRTDYSGNSILTASKRDPWAGPFSP